MKKLFLKSIILSAMILVFMPTTHAGDCTARTQVSQEATISSAVYLRADCPEGEIIGTVPAGEVVKVLEVDNHNEFYLIETSVGTGFVFQSFLTDIQDVQPEGQEYPDSIYKDLPLDHPYYWEISQVSSLGIVSGNPDGTIAADEPINRAALAKILVEATSSDQEINEASLPEGTYTDISPGEWYVKYLQVARLKNIMTGDEGKSTIRPADNANGAEVAKMISVAFALEVDAQAPGESWYERYNRALESVGALAWSSPDHKVTRGEMMYSISKILNASQP